MAETITAILYRHDNQTRTDIEIPLTITANELIVGLTRGFSLPMDTADLSRCFLRSENPIAFLRGNKLLEEYGLRTGTVIHFAGQGDCNE